MLSLKESLKILKETKALLEGHFILSSGLHSAQYVQCAQLMSKPNQANKICISLSEKISKAFKTTDKTEIKGIDRLIDMSQIGDVLKMQKKNPKDFKKMIKEH